MADEEQFFDYVTYATLREPPELSEDFLQALSSAISCLAHEVIKHPANKWGPNARVEYVDVDGERHLRIRIRQLKYPLPWEAE